MIGAARMAMACSLLLSACAGTAPPRQVLTSPAAPVAWSIPATSAADAVLPLFDDPLLAGLQARALQANQDIALATARLREARIQAGMAASANRPTLRATASYARERESRNAPRPVLVTASGDVEADRGSSDNLYQAGFDAAWEIDLFGAQAHASRAAQNEAEAYAFDVAAVRHSIVSEVARQYVLLREAQHKVRFARDELHLQKELLQLAGARHTGGMDTQAGMALAGSHTSQLEANISLLELDTRTALHRLCILLGLPPEELRTELGEAGKLPRARSGVDLALPSELLQRRPDIQRAQRQLTAAAARRALAVADLYPKLTIGATVGVSSVSGANLFSAASLLTRLGPSMTWPILRRGQIIGNIEVRDAQELAAFAAYRQTILLAFEEVENALAGIAAASERRAALDAMVRDDELAVALAQARYQGGMTDLRGVLEARIALAHTNAELLHAEALAASAAIAASKAAGGNWNAP